MTDLTLLGHMPPEYLKWADDHYDDLVKFARSRNSGADAVDDAILRTSHSEKFPVNDMTLWWSWHRWAVQSYISHQARGAARAADLAQEVAGAITSERGTRRMPADPQAAHERPHDQFKRSLHVYHTEEEKPEGAILQPAMRGWYHVCEVTRCRRCGLQVRWEMEREPFDDALDGTPTLIPVAACYGCGRRDYGRVPGYRGPLFGGE